MHHLYYQCIKELWALLALVLFHGDDSPHLPEVLKAGALQDRTSNSVLSTIWPFWRFEVLCLIASVWVLHLMKNIHALDKIHELEQKGFLFLTVFRRKYLVTAKSAGFVNLECKVTGYSASHSPVFLSSQWNAIARNIVMLLILQCVFSNGKYCN